MVAKAPEIVRDLSKLEERFEVVSMQRVRGEATARIVDHQSEKTFEVKDGFHHELFDVIRIDYDKRQVIIQDKGKKQITLEYHKSKK